MGKLLSSEDVGSLLAPVSLGSFSLTPIQGSRQSYAGIPHLSKSKMWDYALTEDGKKNRVLSFLLDNKAVNFELEQASDKGQPIGAKRLPDTESADFGVGGQSHKGRVQIHKSSPDSVMGTFQTGKTNTTFELSKKPGSEHQWHITPRKNPDYDVHSFVNSIAAMHGKKTAFDASGAIQQALGQEASRTNLSGSPAAGGFLDAASKAIGGMKVPSLSTLTYPLIGENTGASMLGAGAIGAGVMGVRNLMQRLTGQQHHSLTRDLLVGGGVGAGASGLIHMVGGTNGLNPEDKSLYQDGQSPTYNPRPIGYLAKRPTTDDLLDQKYQEMQKNSEELTKKADISIKPSHGGLLHKDLGIAPGEKIPDDKLEEALKSEDPAVRRRAQFAKNSRGWSHKKKEAMFGTGNQAVDLISLQGILGADPSLTVGDRSILLQQATSAMRTHGTDTSVGSLQGTGLGMLAGYVTSKLMGFGGAGTIASMAIGGAIGSSNSSGPTWHSQGFMTY